MRKKTFTLAIGLTLMLSLAISLASFVQPKQPIEEKAAALTMSFSKDIIAKNEMMEMYPSLDLVFSEKEAAQRDERIDKILSDATLAREEKAALLAAEKVYIFESQSPQVETTASSAGDITINAPTIAYDQANGQWILQSTGRWKNHDYSSELNMWHPRWLLFPKGRVKADFEYDDYVGISLRDQYGVTTGVAIQSCSAKFFNGDYTESSTTRSFTSNSDYMGYDIAISDYIYVTKYKYFGTVVEFYWVPYNFITTARYNSNFANFGGQAVTYYIHTWKETRVTNIGLTTSGFSFGVTHVDKAWSGQSGSTTSFEPVSVQEKLFLDTAASVNIENAYEKKRFQFIPSTTDTYVFHTYSSYPTDPILSLLCENLNPVPYGFNDDVSDSDSNARISVNLVAGKKYVLEAYCFEMQTGSFTLDVKYDTPILTPDNEFAIHYRDIGGLNFSGKHGTGYPTKHTYGTRTTLISPTKPDYIFKGWFIDSEGEGTPLMFLFSTEYNEDITLYAKWSYAVKSIYEIENPINWEESSPVPIGEISLKKFDPNPDNIEGEENLFISVDEDLSDLDIFGIQTLSPLKNSLLGMLYDTLFNAEGGDLQQGLAKSLSVDYDAEGNQIFTITLRDNVAFCDGTPLTAYDVWWTIEEFRNLPDTAGYNVWRKMEYALVFNDYTLMFYLTGIDNFYFLYELAMPITGIVAQHGLDYGASINSGSFIISQIIGERIILHRNENWWAGIVPTSAVTMMFVPDATTRAIMLVTGDCHFAFGIDYLDIPTLDQYDILFHSIQNGMQALMFNINEEIMQNFLVRQAIDYGLNYDMISSMLGFEYNGTFLDQLRSPYEPDLAMQLLDEAGYVDIDGIRININLICHQDDWLLAEIIRENLQQIGVYIDITVVDYDLTQEKAQGYELILSNIQLSYIIKNDLEDFINFIQKNYGYYNEQLNQLLEEARQNPILYFQVLQLLNDDLPFINFGGEYQIAHILGLKGFTFYVDGYVDLRVVYLEKY